MDNREYLMKWSKLEDEMLNSSLDKFYDETTWMTEVFLLLQKFERSLTGLGIEWRTSVGLAHMSVKDIHLSFLSLYRRHTAPAYKNLRSALEATTFLNAIKGDEKKALIWLSKKLLDQNNQDYKELFKEGRSDPLGGQLRDRFSFASEQAHANMFKLMSGFKSEFMVEQKAIKDGYSYFDMDDDWFISHAHYHISSVFLILMVFENVFGDTLLDKQFKERLNRKYQDYKEYTSMNLDRILISHKK